MLLTFRDEGSKAAMVFVHGFAGNPYKSWDQFANFFTSDHRAGEWDCFSFGYSSVRTSFRSATADLYATLSSSPLAAYERIALVTHSTGGLIVQSALLDYEDLVTRVAAVFFFALPSNGFVYPPKILTAIPIIGQLLRTFSTDQIASLAPGSPLLMDLRTRWDAKFGKEAPFSYYSIAGARDNVVLLGALATLGAEHRLVADEDHISIIRPTSGHRESIEIVVEALNKQPLPAAPKHKAEVVLELAAKEKRGTYDVFLYYSFGDRNIGRAIAQQLFAVARTSWLIEDQGAGQDWWPKLMKDIDGIRSIAIFFGTNPTADWRKKQLEKVIREFSGRQKPILPVFFSGTHPDENELPELLQTIVPIDWDDKDAFNQLVAGIEGRRIEPGKPVRGAVPIKRDRRGDVSMHRKALWGSLLLLGVGVLVLLARGWFGPGPGAKRATEVKSAYITAGPHNRFAVVVFVHGVFGTKDDTWLSNGRSANFPQLLATDPELRDKVDVFAFEYFTPKFGEAPSIVDLADQLRGELDDHRVFESHQKVVFLAHSMGGIVVRQFLLNHQDLIAKVPMAFFYATPTNGSEMASVGKLVSANPQLRGMVPLEGNDLLQAIQSGWLNSPKAMSIASYCAVEDRSISGIMIVTRSSATSLCNRPLDPITANHIEIVKPADRGDSRYTRFASALQKEVFTPELKLTGPGTGSAEGMVDEKLKCPAVGISGQHHDILDIATAHGPVYHVAPTDGPISTRTSPSCRVVAATWGAHSDILAIYYIPPEKDGKPPAPLKWLYDPITDGSITVAFDEDPKIKETLVRLRLGNNQDRYMTLRVDWTDDNAPRWWTSVKASAPQPAPNISAENMLTQ